MPCEMIYSATNHETGSITEGQSDQQEPKRLCTKESWVVPLLAFQIWSTWSSTWSPPGPAPRPPFGRFSVYWWQIFKIFIMETSFDRIWSFPPRTPRWRWSFPAAPTQSDSAAELNLCVDVFILKKNRWHSVKWFQLWFWRVKLWLRSNTSFCFSVEKRQHKQHTDCDLEESIKETHHEINIDLNIFKTANQEWPFHAQIHKIKVWIVAFIRINYKKKKHIANIVATF